MSRLNDGAMSVPVGRGQCVWPNVSRPEFSDYYDTIRTCNSRVAPYDRVAPPAGVTRASVFPPWRPCMSTKFVLRGLEGLMPRLFRSASCAAFVVAIVALPAAAQTGGISGRVTAQESGPALHAA